MTREERIAKARQMANETKDERAVSRAEEQAALADEVASLSESDVRSRAATIGADTSIGYLAPVADPGSWYDALQSARTVVVECARRGRTLTYGELQVAAVAGSNKKIGYSMYGEFCMNLNDYENDGCLISSIIVAAETGEPGPGLLPYARDLGIDLTLSGLQALVFERFATTDESG